MKIYLAGPEVFFPDPHKEGQRLKDICAQYGFEGVFPLDGDLDIDGLEDWEIAEAIFDANIQKIDGCSAVIANMTPFRGPGMDAGTAFEIGYAYAEGKMIIGWSSDDRDYIERVREYFDGKVEKADRWRDPQGLEVEDFGQPDNLMMASAVLDVVSDFETALKLLKNIVEETEKHGVDWDKLEH
jgi:nucleoside 2-deoxyribosyltransferase